MATVRICLTIALLSCHQTVAKFSQDQLQTEQNWHFLDRFCFVSETGALRYEFSYPLSFRTQYVYLYYDGPDQWPAIYRKGKTCAEKISVLRKENNQIITLNPETLDYYEEPVCTQVQRNGKPWLECIGSRRFISARERWWYIAVGNCNSTVGLYLDYKLWMTNGDSNDEWQYHFSADEFYILHTDVVFLFIEVAVFVLSVSVAVVLRSRQLFHSTYKLFMLSLALECLSLLCDSIAFGRYSSDGVGAPMLRRFGYLLRASSNLTFILLLVLLGKGWTITRGRLSRSGVWRVMFFACALNIFYMGMFIYQFKVFDPGLVLYMYESPPGYGILAMRLVAWLWFCYAVYFTLVKYPEKRSFYFVFTAASSLWFWMTPMLIVFCNFILNNWVREKIANGSDNAISLFGFLSFLVITRPSAANGNFPYHVRTTQIDALNEQHDDADPDAAVDLPHHAYEVRYRPQHDAVFTVLARQAEGADLPLCPPVDAPPPPPAYDFAVAHHAAPPKPAPA